MRLDSSGPMRSSRFSLIASLLAAKRDVLSRLERESEQEIALIAVGTQQGSDRIAKSFRPPTHVAKFGADPHSTELKCHAPTEDESDIVSLVELGSVVDLSHYISDGSH